MERRKFLIGAIGLSSAAILGKIAFGGSSSITVDRPKVLKTDKEWRDFLTPEQYYVLREQGTEKANSGPLSSENRSGIYACVGCDLPLFTSDMKYHSKSGWPSFHTTLPDVFETSYDFKMIIPRKEYHCAQCDGHHGHLFSDGPEPTGQRWCNNGAALKFILT